MASQVDVLAVRKRIGRTTPPVDAELSASLDRLGSVEAVALEVLSIRLADLQARPLKFSADGEFSEDYSQNIGPLERAIAELSTTVEVTAGVSSGLTVTRLVRPSRQR